MTGFMVFHSLQVDEDVFSCTLLPTQEPSSLCYLVVDVVKADSGAMTLFAQTCRLKKS